MYIAKAAAVFAAALFCLASPATANGTTNQTLAGKSEWFEGGTFGSTGRINMVDMPCVTCV